MREAICSKNYAEQRRFLVFPVSYLGNDLDSKTASAKKTHGARLCRLRLLRKHGANGHAGHWAFCGVQLAEIFQQPPLIGRDGVLHRGSTGNQPFWARLERQGDFGEAGCSFSFSRQQLEDGRLGQPYLLTQLFLSHVDFLHPVLNALSHIHID